MSPAPVRPGARAKALLRGLWQRLPLRARVGIRALLWRVLQLLPRRPPSYEDRLAQELDIYRHCEDVNALPEIFHYWSDRYVRPMQEEVGASNPDQFFARFLKLSAQRTGSTAPVFVSIGAGNCDTEVRVSKLLLEYGLDEFVIQCLDINPAMLDRGIERARREGVERHIQPLIADFNRWQPEQAFDGIMANQSLHHVVELEHLFSAVFNALKPQARFVVSDMIGRNGHMRWPEALTAVQRFWQELPDSYRYNRMLRRHEHTFVNWDCSKEGFEGIRAQDILPLLVDRFEFEVFIGFGNVVDIFVDRSFGHNFDASAAWDRDFVDRLHAWDEQEMQAGRLTPTHMVAVLARQAQPSPHYSRGLSPAACIRRPQR